MAYVFPGGARRGVLGMSHPLGRRVLSQVLRRYPLKSGLGTIAELPIVRRLTDDAGASDRAVVVRARGGLRLLVKPDDYNGRVLALFGEYDPKVSWVVDRIIEPGHMVLDVGANLGVVTMRCAARLQGKGAEHAVEPQHDLAELVRESAQLNGYTNIVVHELALSDGGGVATLSIPDHHSGAASIAPGQVAATGSQQTIRTATADAHLRELAVDRWRLWKIDVEGHEAAVLRGAAGILHSPARPDVVVFEEHARPPARAESVRLLVAAGYRVFAMPRALLRVRLRSPETHASRDYVAISEGAYAEVMRRLRIPG